jgi:hypothetical protein
MMIIGVDYHPSFQQIAFLNHDNGEAERFYWDLKQCGISGTSRDVAGRSRSS